MWKKIRALIFGKPRDVRDKETFHAISLVAMLAWVGLGADGLSSSAYGPEEAFKMFYDPENGIGKPSTSLAVFLALGTAITVLIISYAYSRIIEQFPSGGGGYLVATKLLGPKFGVVSGSALLVDYVLTISTSIASGAETLFNFVKNEWFGLAKDFDANGNLTFLDGHGFLSKADIGGWADPRQRVKIAIEIGAILLLTVMNIRGVKESVKAILPIFLLFVATHAILLVVSIGGEAGRFGEVWNTTTGDLSKTTGALGTLGAIALFVRAYSMGAGTYTGIEAVSNGVQIMREPKVRTAKRTMVLMAVSLAVTAGGIILCFLLKDIEPKDGTTMAGQLLEKVTGTWTIGNFPIFYVCGVVAEVAILFIAAQAGFVDGPRVMANMAVDSWLPHRFAALSERLSMQNGVMIMGFASVGVLVYTHGDISTLLVMYSINVFVTFSLSNLGMVRFWVRDRKEHADWWKHLPVHVIGLALCLTILVVVVIEKFLLGGWVTLVVTTALVVACLFVRRHYGKVVRAIRNLDEELPDPLPPAKARKPAKSVRALGSQPDTAANDNPKIDGKKPVAILFVGGYGGLGRHALLTLLRMFPNHFKGVVFCSVAIIDSGNFKGVTEVEELESRVRAELDKYVQYAATLDVPAEAVFATGIEVAVEAEKLGLELIGKYPRGLFVAGQLIFDVETFLTRLLHNETAFMIQRRLQHAGIPMVVLPVRLNLRQGPRITAPSLTSERQRDPSSL